VPFGDGDNNLKNFQQGKINLQYPNLGKGLASKMKTSK
jgi:hypothetical protein